MKLLDCTLRDGANVVGLGFSAELTKSILEGLLKNGISDIEFGNAKGLSAYETLNAKAPLTDLEYMELAKPYLSRGKIGMFQLASCANESDIALAKKMGLSFLRVGANAGEGSKAVKAVQMVKQAGLTCRYSLMKAYVCSPVELAAEALMLQNAGVDKITIMDSAGCMFPDDVKKYVAALKKVLTIPVGFHGHSNLGLSQANALAAAAAGADEIDGGLLGMARSAGNCCTELAVAALQKQGLLTEVNLTGLLDYLEQELMPAMKAYHYTPAVTPIELILGLYGCHSTKLPLFEQTAAEYGVSIKELIAKVSAIDRKNPSPELIKQEAEKIKENKS